MLKEDLIDIKERPSSESAETAGSRSAIVARANFILSMRERKRKRVREGNLEE